MFPEGDPTSAPILEILVKKCLFVILFIENVIITTQINPVVTKKFDDQLWAVCFTVQSLRHAQRTVCGLIVARRDEAYNWPATLHEIEYHKLNCILKQILHTNKAILASKIN